MKRKMTALVLILSISLPPLCALPQGENPAENRGIRQPEQKSGSGTSFQTVTSEQIEQIYEVIDDMCDQWKKDVAGYEELVQSLCKENEALLLKCTKISEGRRFWIKLSVCEALVIAAGAYCIQNFNK